MNYIEFEELGPLKKKSGRLAKTNRWRVVMLYSRDTLGDIAWFNPWRRYCFWPEGDDVFDAECLRAIAAFCEQETEMQRETKSIDGRKK